MLSIVFAAAAALFCLFLKFNVILDKNFGKIFGNPKVTIYSRVRTEVKGFRLFNENGIANNYLWRVMLQAERDERQFFFWFFAIK